MGEPGPGSYRRLSTDLLAHLGLVIDAAATLAFDAVEDVLPVRDRRRAPE